MDCSLAYESCLDQCVVHVRLPLLSFPHTYVVWIEHSLLWSLPQYATLLTRPLGWRLPTKRTGRNCVTNVVRYYDRSMTHRKDKATRLGRQLPVFVFPEELTYTANDTKKILTIYNPYEFDVEYRGVCVRACVAIYAM